MPNNYYDTLGISKDATETDIKKAYRSLSLKYHPDRNPDTEDKYKEINEAYETLSDSQRRQQYDMGFGGGGGAQGMPADFQDINQFFNMMFGGAMGGMAGMPGIRVHHMGGGGPGIHIFQGGFPGGHPFQQFQKPHPIIKNVTISLEQVYQGCVVSLEVDRWKLAGDVKVNEQETMLVNVPPGIDEGEMILLQEKGNIINESCKGDIKILFKIENNTPFQRAGIDLIVKKTISLKEALCGFKFDLNHPSGKILNFNNSSSNTIIKPQYKKVIPGLGIQRNGQIGNMIVDFDIDFPNSLTSEQIAKLTEIL